MDEDRKRALDGVTIIARVRAHPEFRFPFLERLHPPIDTGFRLRSNLHGLCRAIDGFERATIQF